MSQRKKLNIFQRGILQPIVYALIGAGCLFAIEAIFYYIGKYNIIQNTTLIYIFCFIGVVTVLAVIGIALPMASLKLNLAWKATLPEVVEFTAAMRKLGLFDFNTQLAFISAQKVSVFIADNPILHDIQKNARVKKYMFLSHKNVLLLHKGKGTLCLDAEEYERIARDVQTPFSTLESTAQSELLRKTIELDKLAAENASLKQKYSALKNSSGTAAGRPQANENFHATRAPFWLVAAPLIQRLRRDYVTDSEYSKDDIQIEFERELENYPALKDAIMNLLATETKSEKNKPFSLDGWGMRVICDTLREYYDVKIKNTPGPKSKK